MAMFDNRSSISALYATDMGAPAPQFAHTLSLQRHRKALLFSTLGVIRVTPNEKEGILLPHWKQHLIVQISALRKALSVKLITYLESKRFQLTKQVWALISGHYDKRCHIQKKFCTESVVQIFLPSVLSTEVQVRATTGNTKKSNQSSHNVHLSRWEFEKIGVWSVGH